MRLGKYHNIPYIEYNEKKDGILDVILYNKKKIVVYIPKTKKCVITLGYLFAVNDKKYLIEPIDDKKEVKELEKIILDEYHSLLNQQKVIFWDGN